MPPVQPNSNLFSSVQLGIKEQSTCDEIHFQLDFARPDLFRAKLERMPVNGSDDLEIEKGVNASKRS
jgi:hypothetical protein